MERPVKKALTASEVVSYSEDVKNPKVRSLPSGQGRYFQHRGSRQATYRAKKDRIAVFCIVACPTCHDPRGHGRILWSVDTGRARFFLPECQNCQNTKGIVSCLNTPRAKSPKALLHPKSPRRFQKASPLRSNATIACFFWLLPNTRATTSCLSEAIPPAKPTSTTILSIRRRVS